MFAPLLESTNNTSGPIRPIFKWLPSLPKGPARKKNAKAMELYLQPRSFRDCSRDRLQKERERERESEDE